MPPVLGIFGWNELGLFVTLREAYRGEMYSGHGRLSVCLSVRRRIPTLLHGPGYKLGECLGVAV